MTSALQAADVTNIGPERPGGQGLDPNQEESGNSAIHKLLASTDGTAWTDFVATMRTSTAGETWYEAWARRGMVRWVREYAAEGGYDYRVVEVIGENPLERQDPFALSTFAAEMAAAGNPADVQAAYVPHAATTYPYAYERLSQLFDNPNAPDLVVNSESYAFGRLPGQHGNLDVVQSRSPLTFSGPGVRSGARLVSESRQIDIAPTIARRPHRARLGCGQRCRQVWHTAGDCWRRNHRGRPEGRPGCLGAHRRRGRGRLRDSRGTAAGGAHDGSPGRGLQFAPPPPRWDEPCDRSARGALRGHERLRPGLR